MGKQPQETATKKETAVLIGLEYKKDKQSKAEEYLDELEFLALTAGAKTLKRFTQKLEYPDPRTFLGKGKLEEVKLFVEENKVDSVIFDDELSPSQIRNIEKVLACKILDRSLLILDIFAGRARTAQARTQVELAQLQYTLPRLTNLWTHLSKQKGGIGMKGPGETEIETDRRVIRDKISLLKKKLEVIDQQNETRRRNRDDKVRVTLVGYTNVGKSTIMNLLSKSDVLMENKLFATVDSTVRKVVIDKVPFLLSDTVGFIRKLPTQLVESFKSTLDEVREADILIHVVDVSHPGFEEQIAVVNSTLEEINAANKPLLMVFNKIDAVPKHDHQPYEFEEDSPDMLERLRNTWMAKANAPAVFISATNQSNIKELRNVLREMVLKVSGKSPGYSY
jgi:GTP-binding protein HflX